MSEDTNKSEISEKPNKWRIFIRDALIGAAIIATIMYWQTKDMLQSDGSVKVAQQNLVSLQNEVLPLLNTDKTNLIYFFAPWCKICALSIDNLEYLDANKVNVVVVALDYASKQAVETFVEEHEVSATVLLGHDALKSEFKIQGYPSYYLVNEDQKITSRSFGYSTAAGLKLREVFGS